MEKLLHSEKQWTWESNPGPSDSELTPVSLWQTPPHGAVREGCLEEAPHELNVERSVGHFRSAQSGLGVPLAAVCASRAVPARGSEKLGGACERAFVQKPESLFLFLLPAASRRQRR